MIETPDFDLLYPKQDSIKIQQDPDFIPRYARVGTQRALIRLQGMITRDLLKRTQDETD